MQLLGGQQRRLERLGARASLQAEACSLEAGLHPAMVKQGGSEAGSAAWFATAHGWHLRLSQATAEGLGGKDSLCV